MVSVVNFLLGMVLSYVLETPSGASVVVVDLVVFLLFCGVQRIRCRVEKYRQSGGSDRSRRFPFHQHCICLSISWRRCAMMRFSSRLM